MTNFPQIVKDLVEAGLTEVKIAEAVGASQPTINRIKSGKQKNIGHALGSALISLHAQQKVNVSA